MKPAVLPRGNEFEAHVGDLVAKYLARDARAPRHDYFGMPHPAGNGHHCETWRLPVVEPHFDSSASPDEYSRWNEVTFVFRAESDQPLPDVSVTGLSITELRSVQLGPVSDSIYLAATVLLPVGRVYRYALRVDDQILPDPLNPQRFIAANGEQLSTFFTNACFEAVTFEPWEMRLLRRLTNHILPFNTREAELFQLRPGGGPAAALAAQTYRLDHGVGVVNYLDKVLAREERHQLPAYRACLAQINRILRQRNPYLEPGDMPEQTFVNFYEELSSGNVTGWDYTAYSSPSYFLYLLRRHTFTGAFCHPKYGGNVGAAGWLWLADRFRDEKGRSLFAWERGLEPPLGTSTEYHG